MPHNRQMTTSRSSPNKLALNIPVLAVPADGATQAIFSPLCIYSLPWKSTLTKNQILNFNKQRKRSTSACRRRNLEEESDIEPQSQSRLAVALDQFSWGRHLSCACAWKKQTIVQTGRQTFGTNGCKSKLSFEITTASEREKTLTEQQFFQSPNSASTVLFVSVS